MKPTNRQLFKTFVIALLSDEQGINCLAWLALGDYAEKVGYSAILDSLPVNSTEDRFYLPMSYQDILDNKPDFED
jgi:hypothetical protein